MAVENYGNKYETTLNGGITNVATSIVVNSTTGVPATPFRAVLTDGTNYEYLNVTGRSGTTLTATREAEDSSRYPKRAWNSGDQLKHVITATGLMSHFDGTSGHDHSGAAGQGPKLPLTSVQQLPTVYAWLSSTQSLSNGVPTEINTWGNEYWDTHAFHATTSGNLTGTVTKTAASATLVGTGTSFTTELVLNQVIDVPGGTLNERRVVTAITDNTHVTVAHAFQYSASGQTAQRMNIGFVVPFAGTWVISAVLGFAANATGARTIQLYKNTGDLDYNNDGQNIIANVMGPAGASAVVSVPAVAVVPMAQYDYITMWGTQTSGGALSTSSAPTCMLVWWAGNT